LGLLLLLLKLKISNQQEVNVPHQLFDQKRIVCNFEGDLELVKMVLSTLLTKLQLPFFFWKIMIYKCGDNGKWEKN